MVQDRRLTLRVAFVLLFALALGLATPTAPAPGPLLKDAAIGEYDFWSCDRDWNHVDDFWTFNPEDLYRPVSVAEESPD